MPDTPEQLAEKVRAGKGYGQDWSIDHEALDELVARLAAAETDRDEVTVELAALLAEFKLQRDERDRLAAALERIGRSSGISLQARMAREALNPGAKS